MLIPDLIFLLFIVIKWVQARRQINTNKPLLMSITCLLLTVTLVNILRCLFVMIFPDPAFHSQEIITKVNKRK